MAAPSLAVETGVRRWWVLVLIGLVSIAAGVVALAYTGLTLLVVGLIFGINLLVYGTLTLITAFEPGESGGESALHVFAGIIGLLAGLICVVHPGTSVLVIVIVMGFWFILVGALDIARAVQVRQHRVLYFLLGLVAIAAGIIVLGNPDIGLETLALLVGIGFLVRGTLAVIAGWALKKA